MWTIRPLLCAVLLFNLWTIKARDKLLVLFVYFIVILCLVLLPCCLEAWLCMYSIELSLIDEFLLFPYYLIVWFLDY